MNADVINEFLVSVGFELDSRVAQQVETAVAGAAQQAIKIGPAIERAAAGIIIFTNNIAGGLNNLLSTSPLTALLSAGIQVMQNALFTGDDNDQTQPDITPAMGNIVQQNLKIKALATGGSLPYAPTAGNGVNNGSDEASGYSANRDRQASDANEQSRSARLTANKTFTAVLSTLPAALSRAFTAVGLLTNASPMQEVVAPTAALTAGADNPQMPLPSEGVNAPRSTGRQFLAQLMSGEAATGSAHVRTTAAGASQSGLMQPVLAASAPLYRVQIALLGLNNITSWVNNLEGKTSAGPQGPLHALTGKARDAGTGSGEAAGSTIATGNAGVSFARSVRQRLENLSAALLSYKLGLSNVQRYGLALMAPQTTVISQGYGVMPVGGANRETNITIYGVSDPVLAAREVSAQVEQVSSRLANLYYSGQR